MYNTFYTVHLKNFHVTVHRNKFLCNKINQMHQFHKFIFSWNSTCFGEFVCPSSGVYSLYTQQWYMSYRFVDSFRAGPGWNCSSILTTLADTNRTSVTNTYCVYTVLRYSWWLTVYLSETCRVFYQINLRNSAPRWLLL